MSAMSMAPDAAMVLGIASTAMPFAKDPEAEIERWLRILRLHGEAGAALQAIGIGEAILKPGKAVDELKVVAARSQEQDAVEQVAEEAGRIARSRGAFGITTVELLLAVMELYGPHFDRMLEAYGTDRAELTKRLDAVVPAERCPTG